MILFLASQALQAQQMRRMGSIPEMVDFEQFNLLGGGISMSSMIDEGLSPLPFSQKKLSADYAWIKSYESFAEITETSVAFGDNNCSGKMNKDNVGTAIDLRLAYSLVFKLYSKDDLNVYAGGGASERLLTSTHLAVGYCMADVANFISLDARVCADYNLRVDRTLVGSISIPAIGMSMRPKYGYVPESIAPEMGEKELSSLFATGLSLFNGTRIQAGLLMHDSRLGDYLISYVCNMCCARLNTYWDYYHSSHSILLQYKF